MEATNKMLDAFHAMNVVIQKDVNASEGEALLLRYTAAERAERKHISRISDFPVSGFLWNCGVLLLRRSLYV